MALNKKFNLRYKLLYQYDINDDTKFIEIQYPITIEFLVQRGTGTNSATFTIYNLSPKNVDIMRFNPIINAIDSGGIKWHKIILELGYGAQKRIQFIGNVQEAWTIKSGSDIKTMIQATTTCFYLNNGYITEVINEGSSYLYLAQKLTSHKDFNFSKQWKNVDEDFLSSNLILRPKTIVGRPLQLLQNIFRDDFSFDLQQISIRKNLASITSKNYSFNKQNVFIINDDTGLLGTPKYNGAMVEIEVVLEPLVDLFDVVYLESQYAQKFNGLYKILRIIQDGMITYTGTSNSSTSRSMLSKFDGELI